MSDKKTVKVGDTVTFINEYRLEQPALVTAVWSDTCINVLFISRDENKTDSYGRQIERNTSVMHKSCQGEVIFGNCWY